MTNHAVCNRADLRERTKTMSRYGDRRGQIATFRDNFETINWLRLLFKCGIKTKTHFEWLLWHWSSLGQLNLEPTRPNGLVGCKVPTDLVKISVKEATHMGFCYNVIFSVNKTLVATLNIPQWHFLSHEILSCTWASCQIRKIAGAHAPGMPGTFSPSPQVSDPDMHHGTCVTHVPWCMPGSLTSSFLWNRRRGKTFPAFPAHAQAAILRIW